MFGLFSTDRSMLAVFLTLLAVVHAQFLFNHGGSCVNRCYTANNYTTQCQCDSDCEDYHNCCPDFWTTCRGSGYGLMVTQQDLNTFAQSIWDHDYNRVNRSLYKMEYENHIEFGKQRLIQPRDGRLDALLSSPNSTYEAFIRLLDNYEAEGWVYESRTVSEIQEEQQFWTLASNTYVMRLAYMFLQQKGFIKDDWNAFHTVINELWFEPYDNIKNISHPKNTGFEKVVVGERYSNNASVGFTNWVRFYLEAKAGNIDYTGYQDFLADLNLVSVGFKWEGVEVKKRSFFVGTSPEFDLALITVCALVRPNSRCDVIIDGEQVLVVTRVRQEGETRGLSFVAVYYNGVEMTGGL